MSRTKQPRLFLGPKETHPLMLPLPPVGLWVSSDRHGVVAEGSVWSSSLLAPFVRTQREPQVGSVWSSRYLPKILTPFAQSQKDTKPPPEARMNEVVIEGWMNELVVELRTKWDRVFQSHDPVPCRSRLTRIGRVVELVSSA